MPTLKKYDLAFRPRSYWGPQDVRTHFGARIKGELGREAALEDLMVGRADPVIVAESLSDKDRSAAGAVHPSLMGGEYLADLYPKEVEIARVTLTSTTMDVISIRARLTKHRIMYRIVDEYPEEGYVMYELSKKSGVRPLTLQELITLMDGAIEGGLVGNGRDFHADDGQPPEEIYDFETASSAFYAQLTEWYDEVNEEWLESRTQEELRAEKEDEYEERFYEGAEVASSDEKLWREKNIERLQLELSIETHLRSAKWVRSEGRFSGMGNQKKYESIRNYVVDYYEKYGELPKGKHVVETLEVEFTS